MCNNTTTNFCVQIIFILSRCLIQKFIWLLIKNKSLSIFAWRTRLDIPRFMTFSRTVCLSHCTTERKRNVIFTVLIKAFSSPVLMLTYSHITWTYKIWMPDVFKILCFNIPKQFSQETFFVYLFVRKKSQHQVRLDSAWWIRLVVIR